MLNYGTNVSKVNPFNNTVSKTTSAVESMNKWLAAYRKSIPFTATAGFISGESQCLSPFQWFECPNPADGLLNADYFTKLVGSLKFKILDIQSTVDLHSPHGAGRLCAWFAPHSLQKDIPVLTGGYVPGPLQTVNDVSRLAFADATRQTALIGKVAEQSYIGYTGDKKSVTLCCNLSYAQREQEEMIRYVKRNSGVVIQLDNMSSFQLSMYKFLGKYMSHRWVQEPSTFDSKNARQNFETYSLGALCFAYLPEMTVHVSDSMQRCQYFDRRGNLFTMNARMMG